MRTILAMTGASGAAFGVEFLKRCPGEKILIVSKWGKSVLHQETGLTTKDLLPNVDQIYSAEDMNSPIASGSNPFDQLVVLPCSVTTLGRLAQGIGENLISRVGEVALKENRKILLGVRETPLSAIALENCLKLSRLGVTIMPISPPFYFRATTLDQMISSFIDHVLTTLKLESRSGWRSASLPS